MSKLFGLAVAAATVLFMVAERPVVVLAHAEYDHSDPADGATVTTAPSTIKVWFSEGVKSSGSSLKVTNASGQQVDNKDSKVDTSQADRKLMTVTLPPNLPDSTYTVNWVTVSADDNDKDDGKFSFTVKSAAPTSTSAPAPVTLPAVAPPALPALPSAAPAPAAQPAPLQGPKTLPRTGSNDSGTLPLLAAFGGLFLFVGILTRRRQPTS